MQNDVTMTEKVVRRLDYNLESLRFDLFLATLSKRLQLANDHVDLLANGRNFLPQGIC